MTENHHQEFVELLARHRTQLFGYLYALVRNLDDAEDLYQQTSLVLWRKFDQFQPDTSFVHWACATARLEFRNFLRKQRPGRLYFSDDLQSELATIEAEIGLTEIDSRREALATCLDKLSSSDRTLIEQCYGDSDRNNIKQVAESLGRSAQSVYDALSRIRNALFRCVERTLSRESRG